MSLELRIPTAEDVPAMFAADGRAFGQDYTDEMIAERLPAIDLDRFRIVLDRGRVVGVIGSYAFDMTLPGGSTVPASGVTWVSVAVTHRRQGLLRRMMDEIHSMTHERGEPIAALGASEGSIYRRFGYGVATTHAEATVRSDRVRLPAERGTVRPLDLAEGRAHMEPLWDRWRRERAGEVSRSDGFWELLTTLRSHAVGDRTKGYVIAHDDGYAWYRVTPKWDDVVAGGTVHLQELVALTPEAHATLWRTLAEIDLMTSIRTTVLALDDPLLMRLDDTRAVSFSEVVDGMWVRPMDPVIAFAARTYGMDDSIVLEIVGTDRGTVRVRIDGGPAGAEARLVRSRPDVVTDLAGAGSLLLGGVRAGQLARAGILSARNADALRRADRFLLGDHLPLCQTGF